MIRTIRNLFSLLALLPVLAVAAEPASVKVDAKTGALITPTASTFRSANGIGTGSGTVTSVSVSSANGISGSVSNSTTNPTITLSLDAITPTSISLSGGTGRRFSITPSGSADTYLSVLSSGGTDAITMGWIASDGRGFLGNSVDAFFKTAQGVNPALAFVTTGTTTFSGAVAAPSLTIGGSAAVTAARSISTSGLASGGGNLSADRTISVPIASQAEAEAGTANDKAMTPLRTAQAISALGGSGSSAIVTNGVAWIAPSTGNDGTGEIGNPAKPFATAQAAYDAGASCLGFLEFGNSVGDLVLSGSYLVLIGVPGQIGTIDCNGLDPEIRGVGPGGPAVGTIRASAGENVTVRDLSVAGFDGTGTNGSDGARGADGASPDEAGANGEPGSNGAGGASLLAIRSVFSSINVSGGNGGAGGDGGTGNGDGSTTNGGNGGNAGNGGAAGAIELRDTIVTGNVIVAPGLAGEIGTGGAGGLGGSTGANGSAGGNGGSGSVVAVCSRVGDVIGTPSENYTAVVKYGSFYQSFP